MGVQEAMVRLGDNYMGSSRADDRIRGFNWVLNAAVDGHSEAMSRVGRWYLDGISSIDLERNVTDAFYWTSQAAEHDEPYAQVLLGTEAAKFDGLVSQEESLAWLKRAAQGLHAEAIYAMSKHFKNSSVEESLEWLRKAAHMGMGNAMVDLAKGLLCRGEEIDNMEAIGWLSRHVEMNRNEKGSERAMVYFGVALVRDEESSGAEPVPKMALKWLRRAGEALEGGATGIANLALNAVVAHWPDQDGDDGEEADTAFDKAERNIDRKHRRVQGETGVKSSGDRLEKLALESYGEDSMEWCLGPYAARAFAAYEHEANADAAKYWFKKHIKHQDEQRVR